MVDPSTTGTPPEAVADGGNAGTTTAPADGGLMAGLTPDQKALFQAQEKKAADGNVALERARAAEDRVAALEQQFFQQTADPVTQRVLDLNQRAVLGDVEAQGELQTMMVQATQQKELELNDAMIEAQVPHGLWKVVKANIRQSGYRLDVPAALVQARGTTEGPAQQERLRVLEEENRRLRETIDGRTVGGAKPNTSTPAAPDAGEGPVEMEHGDYLAALARGGAEATALLKRGVKIRHA